MKNSVFKIFVAVFLILDIFIITFFSQISAFFDFQQFNVSLPINPNGFRSKEQIFVSQMSLEEKVGQMFLVGFWGTRPSENIKDLISERNVGGIILFHYNIESESQLKSLIQDLQEESEIPLFISVDQEGGVVSRIKFGSINELTAQKDIKDADTAYNVGKVRGEELVQLGINMNFSPVLDYAESSNSFLYNRTFHGTREEVGNLASRMIDGYADSKVIAVAKHFPGHPDNIVDSHKDLPSVDIEKDALSAFSSQFNKSLENPNLKVVMSGHISYPEIDGDNSASLSQVLLTDYLKTELGYKGLVITDDLEMGAIANDYGPAESAVKAVLAGNDILMFSSTYKSQIEAYEAVLAAAREGKISEDSIDESVLKILKLKKEYLGFDLSNSK